jgi:hypothetical protein
VVAETKGTVFHGKQYTEQTMLRGMVGESLLRTATEISDATDREK